eukprot:3453994-Amphidinium_carterae.1
MRRAPKGTWNIRLVNPGGDKLEAASGKLPTAAGSPQYGTQRPPVEGQRMHAAGRCSYPEAIGRARRDSGNLFAGGARPI